MVGRIWKEESSRVEDDDTSYLKRGKSECQKGECDACETNNVGKVSVK